jgi:hypothetical protein
MAADAMMLVMVGRAVVVVVLITWRAPTMLHVAHAPGMQPGHHRTRILAQHPRMQPQKQAAHDEPSDENVAHYVVEDP